MAIKLKYVHQANGRWVWRPRIPADQRDQIRTDKNGFLAPPVRLGNITDPDDAIIRAWQAAKNSLADRLAAEKYTLRWIIDQYRNSKTFTDLAPGSQRRSGALLRILDHPIKLNGQSCTLGAISYRHLTRPMVLRLAEKRLERYQAAGRKGEAQVNREISLLSSAAKWAINHLDHLGTTDNPFKIPKFREQPNTRYVTDDEYNQQKTEAEQIADYLPIVFELTYLLASRGVETLSIKLSDINPDRQTGGINVTRTKGSISNTIEWSDRLYAAYLQARARHAQHAVTDIDAPLIINSQGQRLKKSTLDTAMQRLKKRMDAKGLGEIYWSLHKLKSKAISDALDNRIAGHKTEAMRNRYTTKRARFKPPR